MKDLFKHRSELPQEIIKIIDGYDAEEMTFTEAEEMIHRLEQNNYTCSFGMDGMPYELRKLKID